MRRMSMSDFGFSNTLENTCLDARPAFIHDGYMVRETPIYFPDFALNIQYQGKYSRISTSNKRKKHSSYYYSYALKKVERRLQCLN